MHTINMRTFQHNMSLYMKLAQNNPILVTKYGKKAAVILNPHTHTISEKKKLKTTQQILNHPFIGMYKERKDWKGKKSAEIASELSISAWYGK